MADSTEHREGGAPESEGAPEAPKRLRFWQRMLLSLAVMLIMVLLLEGVLSLGSWIFYPRMTRTDAKIGWNYVETHHPVTRRFMVPGGKDIVYDMSINSDGFRDDTFANRPDWLDIMVLGDSMTFGLEACQKDLFCKRLEDHLKQYLGTDKVDVMNFGITGFGVCQEALVLDEYIDKYSPNAVVVMLSAANDFENNVNYSTTSRFRPHFRLDGDGLKLYQDAPLSERVKAWFRDHSTMYFIVSNRISVVRNMIEESLNYTDDQLVELMRRILVRMKGVCDAHGVPMFLFYIQPEDGSVAHRDAIAACCEDNGIVFKDCPLWRRPGFVRNSHWDADGHQKTADVMFDVLSAQPVVGSRLGAGAGDAHTSTD